MNVYAKAKNRCKKEIKVDTSGTTSMVHLLIINPSHALDKNFIFLGKFY